jgi:hypothetical protein
VLDDNNKYDKELKEQFKNIKNLELNESIKEIYNGLSLFIETYFSCDKSTNKKIGKYFFKYSNDVSINHTFYEVIIKNNVINKYYKLFYINYDYVNIKNPKFNGNYHAILNIVPINSVITNYGIYDKIMSVGIYIYKIIEYKSQCKIADKEREIYDNIGCYTFIGDFMTDVWPLNILKKIEI